MPVPSDEYLTGMAYKLREIRVRHLPRLETIIFNYVNTMPERRDPDELMQALRDVRETLANDWPNPPVSMSASEAVIEAGRRALDGTRMKDTETSRFNCGPHAVLISPGAIDALPPFKVVVWLNADKGNTSHNKKFVEIKSTREFKTREAAYTYGSHLCRRTNEREA